ncbi:MAG: hypothetical protein Q7K44_00810 [Candidatus Liptonbacteria bacterium]|nr:hypothetical protein [Candidatus Liptonbacteria bacterium]
MKNYKPKLKVILTFLIVILIFAFLTFIFLSKRGNNALNSLDSFAQCLASKGITMYGADWCPHCQNEKNRFGSSFRFVPYVECPDDPKRCIAAGVTGYPTWIFPDGIRLEGDQELQKLSDESGCRLQNK